MLIRRFVYGIPKGQPRPRAFSRGGVARVYDPGTAEGWKGQIAIAFKDAKPAQPFEGELRLSIEFLFPRPKSLSRKKDPEGLLRHVSKPDVDNAAKAVMDALQTLGFFRDDCQVVDLWARKWMHSKVGMPGALVTLESALGEAPAWVELVAARSAVATVGDAAELVCGPGAIIETVDVSRVFGAEPEA